MAPTAAGSGAGHTWQAKRPALACWAGRRGGRGGGEAGGEETATAPATAAKLSCAKQATSRAQALGGASKLGRHSSAGDNPLKMHQLVHTPPAHRCAGASRTASALSQGATGPAAAGGSCGPCACPWLAAAPFVKRQGAGRAGRWKDPGNKKAAGEGLVGSERVEVAGSGGGGGEQRAAAAAALAVKPKAASRACKQWLSLHEAERAESAAGHELELRGTPRSRVGRGPNR